MASRGLLSVEAAVKLLTTDRKTRPSMDRVTAVLSRLDDRDELNRLRVLNREQDYWRPLPARAVQAKRRKARRPAPAPVEAWGPGVQLDLFPVGVEVEF